MKKKVLKRLAAFSVAMTLMFSSMTAFAAETTYTTKTGDNLSKIAKELYGDANKWRDIYECNKDQIKDPNLIWSNQILVIPDLGITTQTPIPATEIPVITPEAATTPEIPADTTLTDLTTATDEATNGAMSLKEWTDTGVWAQYMQELNEGAGGAISFEVDGDVLILVYQYEHQLAGLDDASQEMLNGIMDSIFDAYQDVFALLRDEIILETGNANVVLRLEYRNADGAVIYGKNF